MSGQQGVRQGHTVVMGADSGAFASFRHDASPRAERHALGRRLRDQVPRTVLGDWAVPPGRPDVTDLVVQSHAGRLDWLVPVRVGRMISSPYAFLRGAANVHAQDFAGLPATGITPVVCGDAHLGNFGFYASPERELVFDLNDFDEAHPGAWEWDLRRLTTSVWVAGRQNGTPESSCGEAVARCVEEYQLQIAALAERPLLARGYERLDVARMLRTANHASLRAQIKESARRARRRTSDRALPRFTEQRAGTRRLVEEPPLITRPGPAEAEHLAQALDDYLTTLPPHWARILGG
jgi:hypothetical protein